MYGASTHGWWDVVQYQSNKMQHNYITLHYDYTTDGVTIVPLKLYIIQSVVTHSFMHNCAIVH